MKNKQKHQSFDQNNVAGYLFIAPWLLGFIIFTIYPICSSLYYSFTRYDLLSAPQWIGFENYINIFQDSRFYQSMKVTLLFVIVHVPIKLIFALFIALVFHVKRKNVSIYRTIYYFPSIIGGSIAVSVMWRQLFGTKGAFNAILLSLGIITEPKSWIGSPDTSLIMIIILAVWQFGSPMLIFLAGLKQIPMGYYEAAQIDGANWWQRFVKITIPSLSSVIFFNFLMQTIGAFMSFTQAFIISGGTGGPLDSTLFYSLYIYIKAFKYYEMGYGSALAWIMLLIIAVLTGIIFKTSDRFVFYEND